MNITANTLVKQHLAYASEHPEELKRFETISDHMIYYFCSVLGLSEFKAHRVLAEFGHDRLHSMNAYRFRAPISYVRQPANCRHFATYAIAVQALLT
jgi:hypothetical protein